MSTDRYRRSGLLPALAVLAFALPVLAGESDSEPDDTAEHGAPIFGEAKDIRGFEPVADVRIKGLVKGTTRFFITTTDDEGRFKRAGMGTDVDADKYEVTCEKPGFRTIEVVMKRLSKDKHAAVEVECLMEKVKS